MGTADVKLSNGKTYDTRLSKAQCEQECDTNAACKSFVYEERTIPSVPVTVRCGPKERDHKGSGNTALHLRNCNPHAGQTIKDSVN